VLYHFIECQPVTRRMRKKYWLAPIMLMLVVSGGLIILTQGSAVAPFIYTLF
jgi:hypothetical protein